METIDRCPYKPCVSEACRQAEIAALPPDLQELLRSSAHELGLESPSGFEVRRLPQARFEVIAFPHLQFMISRSGMDVEAVQIDTSLLALNHQHGNIGRVKKFIASEVNAVFEGLLINDVTEPR